MKRIIMLTLSLLLSSFSYSAIALDQQANLTQTYTGFSPLTDGPRVQTFTAGASGTLDSIALALWRYPSLQIGTYSVLLKSGHHPDQGAILFSATYPMLNITNIYENPSPEAYTHVDVSQANITVDKDDTFTIFVNADYSPLRFVLSISTGTGYIGGNAFYYNYYKEEWIPIQPNNPTSTFGFETYINTTPEPIPAQPGYVGRP